MLRTDPNFRRLPAVDQQRVVSQLRQVNGLSESQRQRRLARAELIERLSPQERMRVNLSAHRWAELPVDRQAAMKGAWLQLREVPIDQRVIVLNSARYRGLFNPEERGILTDMLRVEPFQPAR
jgi:transposase